MDMNIFNNEELQTIENLLASSNEICGIYEKLYQLEINNQKESNEYSKLLSALEVAIKKEEEIFKQANFKLEDLKKIMLLLSSSNKLLNISNTECVLTQKYDDKITRRIMSIISQKITTDKSFQKDIVTNQISKTFQDLGINMSNEEILKQMNHNHIIQTAIANDVLLIVLSFLEEHIYNNKNNKFKSELTKLKYFISFINTDIEKHMISVNFVPSSSAYISSNLTANLLNIPETQYKIIKATEARSSVIQFISDLVEITDQDYENDKKHIESIIRQIYIRTFLSLMSEDDVYDVNQHFHDFLDNPNYQQSHNNNEISQSAIICCFKCQKYDRPKIRTLTFKLPHQ